MRIITYLLGFIIPVLLTAESQAQEKNPWNQSPDFYFLGYLDVFYAYDFNQPESGVRQPFLYNHNRHNQFNLNNGILGFEISNPKYRAGFGIHTGTYVMDNYSAEPGVLKNIYEAYVGLALNKKNDLWLDAGIFESFIGFENPISIEMGTILRPPAVNQLKLDCLFKSTAFNPRDFIKDRVLSSLIKISSFLSIPKSSSPQI